MILQEQVLLASASWYHSVVKSQSYILLPSHLKAVIFIHLLQLHHRYKQTIISDFHLDSLSSRRSFCSELTRLVDGKDAAAAATARDI